MRRRGHRPVLHRRARGIGAEPIAALPVFRRADGARREAAAAVGAHVEQLALHAVGAKRALVGTDARVSFSGIKPPLRSNSAATRAYFRAVFPSGFSTDTKRHEVADLLEVVRGTLRFQCTLVELAQGDERQEGRLARKNFFAEVETTAQIRDHDPALEQHAAGPFTMDSE